MDTDLYDTELARIREVIQETGDKPDYVDSEMMMRTVYESAFGIHNHYGPNQHPFALVAAHPKEDFVPYSSRFRDYAAYINARVYETTGIPMDKFFDRPRAEIEMIMGLVRVSNRKQAHTADEIAAAARAAQQGKK